VVTRLANQTIGVLIGSSSSGTLLLAFDSASLFVARYCVVCSVGLPYEEFQLMGRGHFVCC
jgi:hypothetical protein